jgi:putative endonuclease
MKRGGSVYIMTNQHHTTLYIGVTSDLPKRISQHREKFYPTGFTAKYNINKLVYFENLPTITEAIAREKQLKAGSRKKKLDLINTMNPKWDDLYDVIREW